MQNVLILMAAVCLTSGATGPGAQPYRYKAFSDLSLSDDGATAAWISSDNSTSTIRVAGKNATLLRQVTATFSGSDISLSHDGMRLAFLSDRDSPGQAELYVASSKGSRRLTSIKGILSSPHWSPNDRELSLLVIRNAHDGAGPLAAKHGRTGVIGRDVVDEQHLVVIDAASARSRTLTAHDEYVYEDAWSPDGHNIAFISANGDGDEQWYNARLSVVKAAGGAERTLVRPRFQIAQPSWINDNTVGYIAGFMSDVISPGGDIYAVTLARQHVRLLHDPYGGSATNIWRCGEARLCLRLFVGDNTALATFDVNEKTLLVRRYGARTLARCTADYRASFLCVAQSFDTPAAVVRLRGASLATLDHNVASGRTWGTAENVRWASGGMRFSGWLLYPRNARARRVPLLVYVHGGPGFDSTQTWPRSWPVDILADALAAGDAVFFPNYRGGFGFGEGATLAIRGSVGRGDVQDVLRGVAAAIATNTIDSRRVGIYGYSWGGSITLAAIGQSRLFRVAVTGGAVADWKSYSGETGIASEVPFFGDAYYNDPHAYDIASPLFYVTKVTTPTLLMQGDEDEEVPATQPYEFWRALQARGVPSRLVIFAHEGHGYTDPTDEANFSSQAERWIRAYL